MAETLELTADQKAKVRAIVTDARKREVAEGKAKAAGMGKKRTGR
jgi:Spy/CpxP family protein refolding chaperone